MLGQASKQRQGKNLLNGACDECIETKASPEDACAALLMPDPYGI